MHLLQIEQRGERGPPQRVVLRPPRPPRVDALRGREAPGQPPVPVVEPELGGDHKVAPQVARFLESARQAVHLRHAGGSLVKQRYDASTIVI